MRTSFIRYREGEKGSKMTNGAQKLTGRDMTVAGKSGTENSW